MVNILRVRSDWTGFVGAPGYTVMHFRDFNTGTGGGTDGDAAQALAAATRVRTFFDAVKAFLPTSVRVSVSPEVDLLEDTTGELVNSFTIASPTAVQGTGTGGYAGPQGAVINWRTAGIRNGRRIRGRTFLVPCVSSIFGVDGQIVAGSRATLVTAAAALADNAGTPDLGVYARPSGPGATDGKWSVVTASTVPSLAAVLRSRRD